MVESLESMIADRKVIVCVGSGGVGKTTISAVVALHAAIVGRKVLVLTIDPARRLANSLGVDALDDEERRIPLEDFAQIGVEPKGELWAMMLDMKRAFDHLVERYAPDKETVEKIFANKLYKYFSTSMAGTQEYSAMERLYALVEEGNYDLIVLDTPPTVHALDFLDAPGRMAEAVESSALQWLYKPSLAARKFGFGLFNIGTSYVLKTIQRFTGAELLDDLGGFLINFRHMFAGFEARARRVREILGSDAASFLVVTSPDPMTVDEARFFKASSTRSRCPLAASSSTASHKPYLPRETLETPTESMAERLAAQTPDVEAAELEGLAKGLLRNAAEFQVLSDLDAQTLAGLDERTAGKTLIRRIPYFSRDIHSFEGLDAVRRALFKV